MCDEFIGKITKMLESLSIDDSREQALDSLNQLFVEFNEDLQLMSDEERAAQRANYIEAQRIFHDAGLRIIGQVSNQQEQQSDQNEMTVDEQKVSNEVEMASTETNDSSASPIQVDVQPSQASVMEQEGAWGGEDETKSNKSDAAKKPEHNASVASVNAHQWAQLPFLDFERLFRPLFELQQMSRVDEAALNQFLAMLVDMREQAERLQFPLEQERQFIIAIIQNRLDYVSRSLWMWQLDRGEPTLEQFTNFLVKRCSRIEMHERQPNQNQALAVAQRPVQAQGAVPRSPVANRAACDEQPSTSKGKKHKPACIECGGEHFLHECSQFKGMTLAQKRALLDFHRMCHNCRSTAHLRSQCKQGVCKRCGTKHNSLLCSESNR